MMMLILWRWKWPSKRTKKGKLPTTLPYFCWISKASLYCFPLLASTIAHKDKLHAKEKLEIRVPWFVNFESKNIDVNFKCMNSLVEGKNLEIVKVQTQEIQNMDNNITRWWWKKTRDGFNNGFGIVGFCYSWVCFSQACELEQIHQKLAPKVVQSSCWRHG